mgnify:CR=1 FL=1
MEAYERRVCRQAGFVVAVSEKDRETMRSRYGVERISAISTGVDLDYFSPPATVEHKADLVFVGSMDWLPNIDGVRFLAEQILPRIRARRPDCRVAIVGRRPDAAVRELGERDPNVIVTGTVADVRPWLWGSSVSIVPLRIGGGTRLKIFEAMAARVPVISTTIGAEGLPVENDRHLFIADDAESFANACLHLLENQQRRHQMADEAWNLVSGQFSWDAVTREFETILENYHAHSASIR